jgi:hypothetical protein
MVSSQAVGKKYSVAKASTLVSVKLSVKNRLIIDSIEALEDITAHLMNRPERQLKSVVVSSLGFTTGGNHEKAKSDLGATLIREFLESFLGRGGPFISSAGNLGRLYPNIDKLPKVLEDPDTPIINVGVVDSSGNIPVWSQIGA